MGGSATPLPLLNGEADAAARADGYSVTTWEPIEALAFQHFELVQDRVRALLAAGDDDRARKLTDEWGLATTRAHLAIIRP